MKNLLKSVSRGGSSVGRRSFSSGGYGRLTEEQKVENALSVSRTYFGWCLGLVLVTNFVGKIRRIDQEEADRAMMNEQEEGN